MNLTLLAREAAAKRGALDPKPEPYVVLTGPTRLHRIVEDDHEIWLEPGTGREVTVDSSK